MQLILRVLCFGLLSIIVVSCWKGDRSDVVENCTKDCINITGLVLSGKGGKPIENVQIELYSEKSGYPFLPTSRTLKAVSHSSNSGDFNLQFMPREGENSGFPGYQLLVKIDTSNRIVPDHMVDFKIPLGTPIVKDTSITIYFPEKRIMGCKLTNPEDLLEGDQLNLRFDYRIGLNGQQWGSSQANWKFGFTHDLNTIIPGGLPIRVNIHRRKNGLNSEQVDSLFLLEGQSQAYQVEF